MTTINRTDRSSLDLPLFFKNFLNAPQESDKNNVGIYIVGKNRSGEFASAPNSNYIAIYDRKKSAWKFIKPTNYQTEMYCLDERVWYKFNNNTWEWKADLINNKPIPVSQPVTNDFGGLRFVDDYIYIDVTEGDKPQNIVPEPLYPTEYKITIKSLTENTVVNSVMKCEYLGDDGTQDWLFPMSINGNCQWSADGIDLNDLDGDYLCKNHPWMIEFKKGAITKVTNIEGNSFIFCRKSNQLISVYLFDMYKKADSTKIDNQKYMQAITIGNRGPKHVQTFIPDLDVHSKTIPEYIELFYPWAQETDPNKLDKYWSDRGFYITNEGAIGSYWELITINRTVTAAEESSKSLVLPYYPMDDCTVLLSCAGVDQYQDLDFVINRDTKTISWDGKGLDGVVKENDLLVITYVTADKDR